MNAIAIGRFSSIAFSVSALRAANPPTNNLPESPISRLLRIIERFPRISWT